MNAYLSLAVLTFAFSFLLWALPSISNLTKGPSEDQLAFMEWQNTKSRFLFPSFHTTKEAPNLRPFVGHEETGYLLMSSEFRFQSRHVKREIARYLPEDVTLVIYTHRNTQAHFNQVINDFKDVISPERMRVIYLRDALGGFWARDGVPIPVWINDEEFSVVDALYYHPFSSSERIAEIFLANLLSHNFYFEGGNFMANRQGQCLVINNRRTQAMPDELFRNFYGCQSTTRFPHVAGIGHIDERIKFINDDTVVSDFPSYFQALEDLGLTVKALPRPRNPFENYANALLINGVIYVPIFGQPTDQEAIAVYEGLGLDKVVPINTRALSNNGRGSIHCITMTYPKVDFEELLKALSAEEVTN